MSAALVLLLATGIVVPSAVAVFVRDLRMAAKSPNSAEGASVQPATSRARSAVEAALPLVGVVLLLWLAWAGL
ncbi:MAG TPA: hypothetical protein VLG28_17480 [Acidimicrobiia bacterium]|jgi:hypothetical protein|nr:hypothetical protein [Acidimicrobiia bacterium]